MYLLSNIDCLDWYHACPTRIMQIPDTQLSVTTTQGYRTSNVKKERWRLVRLPQHINYRGHTNKTFLFYYRYNFVRKLHSLLLLVILSAHLATSESIAENTTMRALSKALICSSFATLVAFHALQWYVSLTCFFIPVFACFTSPLLTCSVAVRGFCDVRASSNARGSFSTYCTCIFER